MGRFADAPDAPEVGTRGWGDSEINTPRNKNLLHSFRCVTLVGVVISCPVEYLPFGGGKAEGTYAGGRRKEKVLTGKGFLSLIIRK